MKVGIVSDTHGRMNKQIALALAECEVVLHAGDYHNPMHIEQLRCCGEQLAEVHAVRGNCDWGNDYPRDAVFDVGGVRFYLTHGDRYLSRADGNDAAINFATGVAPLGGEARRPDVVVFGHSHVATQYHHKGVLFINPGSPVSPRGGRIGTVCVLEIQESTVQNVRFIEI